MTGCEVISIKNNKLLSKKPGCSRAHLIMKQCIIGQAIHQDFHELQ